MSELPALRPDIPQLRTVVIKVGSRIATADSSPGGLAHLQRFADDIAILRSAGVRVVLVSSGAIAHGMRALGLTERPKTLPMQQACAAIGQSRLMNGYIELFTRLDITVGQVLLTWDDLRDKRRYLNLRNTLFHLLDCGTVPIINENDSVGVEEIKLGDNDTLGSQIALLVAADLYVMLTDVNGLYEGNPKRDRNARHIPVVRGVTSDIHALAGGTTSAISVGGMTTKLRAAENVTAAGVCALIGNGDQERLLDVLGKENLSTLFVPSRERMPSRRRWMAFTRQASGAIVVDSGAERALIRDGKSLLPAGVRRHTGQFKAGDLVSVTSENGTQIARGLTNYASAELELIRGCRTSQIASKLGHKTFDEVIHRDNMVITGAARQQS